MANFITLLQDELLIFSWMLLVYLSLHWPAPFQRYKCRISWNQIHPFIYLWSAALQPYIFWRIVVIVPSIDVVCHYRPPRSNLCAKIVNNSCIWDSSDHPGDNLQMDKVYHMKVKANNSLGTETSSMRTFNSKYIGMVQQAVCCMPRSGVAL